ncbi:MAG: LacI family DNA-binding transcriptional regulator [Oscillospiraceae bacterium]|nr:LacI family DNA-binding transcriptional regulator [Oscillospiraceae bacterium]MBR2890711.1 LacI family DNA-binding transcriptional regulator [Oscillospiraceae bacterium]
MGVTIKDVANAAGVSVGTASYALNGTGPVSQEKLQRVQEAARQLGYIPNGYAKALQAQQNGMVGYFGYSLAGPFFGQIMRGIEDAFNATDEEMIACSCSSDKKKVTRFLSQRMVDGAIVFGEHLEDSLIQRIACSACPVVVMDRDLCDEYISSLTIDNQKCAYEVGRYIYEMGFKTVGCIIGEGPDGIRRNKGFRAAVRDFGLDLWEDCVLHGDFVYDAAYATVSEWLKTNPELPEVLFAFNDEMALGTINALKENGLRVPEDVSVIGMDDIPQSAIATPGLTTFHLPIYEHGVQAARLLIDMLKGCSLGSKTVLSGYMVERESCRKPDRSREEKSQ